MKILKASTALAVGLSSLAGAGVKGNLSFHIGTEPLYEFPKEKIIEFELSDEYVYALKDAAGLDSLQLISAANGDIALGEKLMKLDEVGEYIYTNKGYILSNLVSSDEADVYYPEELTRYAVDGAKVYDAEGNETGSLELNTEIKLTAYNSEGWHKYGDYYIAESEFMDSPYVEPTPAVATQTASSSNTITYSSSGSGLTKSSGVNNYGGRRETYYSSNVLYHYRTSEWSLDGEGFYRTSEGYYVVAASDMAQGTTFDCSKGTCMVLDSGCAAGTTDYYVGW